MAIITAGIIGAGAIGGGLLAGKGASASAGASKSATKAAKQAYKLAPRIGAYETQFQDYAQQFKDLSSQVMPIAQAGSAQVQQIAGTLADIGGTAKAQYETLSAPLTTGVLPGQWESILQQHLAAAKARMQATYSAAGMGRSTAAASDAAVLENMSFEERYNVAKDMFTQSMQAAMVSLNALNSAGRFDIASEEMLMGGLTTESGLLQTAMGATTEARNSLVAEANTYLGAGNSLTSIYQQAANEQLAQQNFMAEMLNAMNSVGPLFPNATPQTALSSSAANTSYVGGFAPGSMGAYSSMFGGGLY
jgi:hypothetical protein